MPYVNHNKIKDFIIKVGKTVITQTSCLVELYVLSMIYSVLIYVYDENYNIIYVFHPLDGFVYNYKKSTEIKFDTSKYYGFEKILSILFNYASKNIFPDIIEVLYMKE